jgi:hypothetical protein
MTLKKLSDFGIDVVAHALNLSGVPRERPEEHEPYQPAFPEEEESHPLAIKPSPAIRTTIEPSPNISKPAPVVHPTPKPAATPSPVVSSTDRAMATVYRHRKA